MTDKKKDAPPKILFGRPGNHLKVGIVGMPNVGKSSLFNLLTKVGVPAENYPFCTIEPTTARVAVPDERHDWLTAHWKPKSSVPAVLQVTDIAGLIKGASEGAGLGNSFLSHISSVDGIFHCVRVFDDTEVLHVEGTVDPVRDLEIIATELLLKDIETMEGFVASLSKKAIQHKSARPEAEFAAKVLTYLKEVRRPIRAGEWALAEVEMLNNFYLLTAKPVVYLLNLTEQDYIRKKNKWLLKIKQWIDAYHPEPLIPFSISLEGKYADDPEGTEAFLKESKSTSALPKIITTGYKSLDLVHFFTCGTDEVKSWTVRANTKAPAAAGTIHTDMQKGFIMAEVQAYTDYKELGSETAVRAAGKYRMEGKKYDVQDGDIIFFKFNTPQKEAKKK